MLHEESPLDASITSYRLAGYRPQLGGLPSSISFFVPELRWAELVIADENPLIKGEELAKLERDGIRVTVVAPLNKLAEIRRVVRHRTSYIQGWWKDSDGAIRFDNPRIP